MQSRNNYATGFLFRFAIALTLILTLSCSRGVPLSTPTSNQGASDVPVTVPPVPYTSPAPVVVPIIANANLLISEVNPYSFGQLQVNFANNHLFAVTNVGNGSATNLNIVSPGPTNGFSVLSSTCAAGSTLAPNGNCTVTIQFSPPSAAQYTDSFGVSFVSNASTNLVTRSLTGAGTAATVGHLTILDASPFSYSNVVAGTSPLVHVFQIKNDGNGPASAIVASAFLNNSGFSLAVPQPNGSCMALSSLAAASSCPVAVQFTPIPPAPGSLQVTTTDTLQLSYNNGNIAQTVTDGLSATVIASGALSATGTTPPNFKNVPLSPSPIPKACVVLSNLGGAQITALNVSIAGSGFSLSADASPCTNSSPLPITQCGSSIAPGAYCGIPVAFSPTVSGALSAQVTASYSNGAAPITALFSIFGSGAIGLTSLAQNTFAKFLFTSGYELPNYATTPAVSNSTIIMGFGADSKYDYGDLFFASVNATILPVNPLVTLRVGDCLTNEIMVGTPTTAYHSGITSNYCAQLLPSVVQLSTSAVSFNWAQGSAGYCPNGQIAIGIHAGGGGFLTCALLGWL